ncbi:MAG: hypothetical protein ACRED1_01450 [Limisphaerales bacterium]
MKPLSYRGEVLGGQGRLFSEPRCYIAASHSASSQSTQQKTYTTSGASSPITGAGAAAGSGSIAVGAGGKYLESGAVDQSGSNFGGVGGNITAAKGSTVNIGDQNAAEQLSNLAQQFAQTVQGVAGSINSGSGGGGTVVVPTSSDSFSQALASIPWTTLALIAAAIAAIFVLGNIFEGKK